MDPPGLLDDRHPGLEHTDGTHLGDVEGCLREHETLLPVLVGPLDNEEVRVEPDRKLETGAAGTGQAGGARDPKKPEPGTTTQGKPDGDRDATTSGGTGQAGKKVPEAF